MEFARKAKPFRYEMDFAFFAVNFGYSKADYEALTPKDKVFIVKEWENKKVLDTNLLYRAFYTATYNLNRKRGKKALKLWKSPQKSVDKENMRATIKSLLEAENKSSKDWVARIYEANGRKPPGGRKNG